MVRPKSRIGSGRQRPVVIRVRKNPKMKAVDLRQDALDAVRQKIVEICRKSFYDGGCVNDADLDDVEELIRSRIMK